MLNSQLINRDHWADRGLVIFGCLLLFSLPISIALVESFSGFVILFYILKKIFLAWDLAKSQHDDATSPVIFRESFWRYFRRSFFLPGHPLRVTLLFFMGAVLISVLFSQDRLTSIVGFIGKFVQGVFLMLGFYEGFRRRKDFYWLVVTFIAVAAIVAISALVQLYFGHDLLRGVPLAGDKRISATFRHSNDLGAYMIGAITLVISSFFLFDKEQHKKFRLVFGIILLLLLSVLLLTYSRSSWLGLIMVLGFLMVAFKQLRMWILGLYLLIFLVFIPALKEKRNYNLFTDYVSESAQTELIGNNGNKEETFSNNTALDKVLRVISHSGGSGRAEYWNKAITIIEKAPVFGTGLNTYSKQVAQIPGLWGGGYAHNCYLQMTAEIGLVGITIFFFFLIQLFCYAIKNFYKPMSSWQKMLLIMFTAILLGYLVQSFFDTTFYSVQLGNLLWIYIGIILALARHEIQDTLDKR